MSTTRPLATRRSRGRGAAVILTAALAIAPAAVQAQAALKIPRASLSRVLGVTAAQLHAARLATGSGTQPIPQAASQVDRKSTRLNSSHVRISYAVFCLKKK